MVLPVWPAGLHYKPERTSFRILEATRKPRVTEFEDGPPLARRSGLSRRARMAYSLDFVDAGQYEMFRAFYETTLVDGTQRFMMPVYVPVTNTYVVRTCMIDNGDVQTDARGMGFVTSFTLLVFDW